MTRRLVDISIPLENHVLSDPLAFKPELHYLDHQATFAQLAAFFPGLEKKDLPDGEAWAVEIATINTHNGTHLDAPYHFHSTMNQGEKASEYIFGYLIFNDFSARDAQFQEMASKLGPAKGKDFDTGNAMGPWLVTKDEISDPYQLTMIARVNGEEWGRGYSGDMYHQFEDIIAHVSKCETIYPGEFMGSGTVGDGCGLEQGRFLSPNDTIELEIEGLGLLRNRLVKT